jgi:hypothetical protein
MREAKAAGLNLRQDNFRIMAARFARADVITHRVRDSPSSALTR